MDISLDPIVLVSIAFALGGVLKGAAGAGAPLLAVPLMAILFDVPFAVAVFVIPNLVSNLWQVRSYRSSFPEGGFTLRFALAGMLGALLGTFALVRFSSDVLTTAVGLVILFYVGFRIVNPEWSLAWRRARVLAAPVGVMGGIFQGAAGLSAPFSVTFLNAAGLPRSQFIPVISLYFLAMACVQLPIQAVLGVMTWERLLYSCLAVVPLLLGMPLGEYLGRRVSQRVFGRLILGVLVLLAVRLLTLGIL